MVIVGLGHGEFEAWWLWVWVLVGLWWVRRGESRWCSGGVLLWVMGCGFFWLLCVFVCLFVVVAWGCGFVCFFFFFLSWWRGFCGQCLVVFGAMCVCVCVFFFFLLVVLVGGFGGFFNGFASWHSVAWWLWWWLLASV